MLALGALLILAITMGLVLIPSIKKLVKSIKRVRKLQPIDEEVLDFLQIKHRKRRENSRKIFALCKELGIFEGDPINDIYFNNLFEVIFNWGLRTLLISLGCIVFFLMLFILVFGWLICYLSYLVFNYS